MRFKFNTIMKLFKFWPPFLASGISVKEFDLDKGYAVSQMKLSKWNANAFGTMYGGNLFSMCDPFFIFILGHKLGKDYYLWDLESHIKYVKATKKTVTATFKISDEEVEEIKKQAASGKKVTPTFHTKIIDSDNNVIAEVSKTLYVKLKR